MTGSSREWLPDGGLSRLDPAEFEAMVQDAYLLERSRREARRRVDAEEGLARGEGYDSGSLGEVLARPAEPPERIEGLIPSDASTLIVAQRKAGKTTLTLNLARSLLLGAPFLGRLATRPVSGRVAFLNYEVSGQMLARWAAELEPAIPRERLYLVNLRGRRNPLANPEDRAALAAELREQKVESLIVDPFGRAYTGASQNDSGEVGAFLVQLDEFARGEVGVSDLVLTAHAGWEGTRTRGASALEDWPDSIVTMTREQNDGPRRYLRAQGRQDEELEEDLLAFDPSTRTLVLTGAGGAREHQRTTQRTDRLTLLTPAVVEVVGANPGASVAEVTRVLRSQTDLTFQDQDVRAALRSAADQLLITARSQGAGKRTDHYPVQPRPTPSTDAVPTTPSNPVYRDGVGVGRGQEEASPGRGLCACGISAEKANQVPHRPGCSGPVDLRLIGDQPA